MAYLPIEEAVAATAKPPADNPRLPTLEEVQGDVCNLAELLDILFDEIGNTDATSASKMRASALAWIARDIATKAVADFEANTPILITASRLVREANNANGECRR